MTAGGFQRLNSRAAKVNGEMVMWIRKRYAEMHSYPMIREGLRDNFGVVLSIQQITRIAKGHSFAQLPTVPTEREVDLTMHVNAREMEGFNPSKETISASIQRTLKELAKDAEPQRDVMDILRNRKANVVESEANFAKVESKAVNSAASYQQMLIAAQLQADEQDGSQEAGERALNKLQETLAKTLKVKPNAEQLLETLKDEHDKHLPKPA